MLAMFSSMVATGCVVSSEYRRAHPHAFGAAAAAERDHLALGRVALAGE